ncbi:MAG TPA: hypothetical protein VLY03_00325 [Bacteroidota bacterium]|nr:hypothetical protein [Bacteroidota bacterium]
MNRLWILLLAILAVLVTATPSAACPVCFGAQDSPMTAGMNMAILSMLGIIGFVLSGFVGFFFFIRHRYRTHQRMMSNSAFVSGDGSLNLKNEKGVMEWNNI